MQVHTYRALPLALPHSLSLSARQVDRYIHYTSGSVYSGYAYLCYLSSRTRLGVTARGV